MKRIYKKIKINKELLKKKVTDYTPYLENEVDDILPAGEVKGVYFISYKGNVMSMPPKPPTEGPGVSLAPTSPTALALYSNTDIFITDSRDQLLTHPTDIKDYEHMVGGYVENFKKIDVTSKNEPIKIRWETLGGSPICGEFIFVIEQLNCEC
ncbi:hypothetical protein [uncultured Tenacibaculum sp.]|uniref:hypothetical protein n=1 Tax=uncultured Tenacibaculum sp. TaxID=174713 RepID=UPI00262145AB|nr:hypothetical protein [uncultured Tenacibaculum sp.]